jgi:GxxExxY protein
LKFEDGSYEIIGSAMRVNRALGPGLRETPYENALLIDLREKGFRPRRRSPTLSSS